MWENGVKVDPPHINDALFSHTPNDISLAVGMRQVQVVRNAEE